jgi:WD domain, G-beta repeat
VWVWDTASGRQLKELESHSNQINCVTFSLDGSKVVSRFADKTVQVWDTASGRQLKESKGHSWSVSSVAFPLGLSDIYSVDETRHWITNGSLKILYIPLDLRPARSGHGVFAATANGSSLAIGTESGRVIIIKFRPNISTDSI